MATDFLIYKHRKFGHTSSDNGYDTDACKRKFTFFLKVIAKNIAFDAGYWDLIRNGNPTSNIGGLCYCPCVKWFNNWTEQMCPSVTTDRSTCPCLEDRYISTYDFEQHLFETMRDECSDVYHSLIILYLIKVYPLANTLLEFNNINDLLSIIVLVLIFL